MIYQYLKIAYRKFFGHVLYNGINILGLSIGIACTLWVFSYVMHELRVNQQLRHVERQYMVQSEWSEPGLGFPLTTIGMLPRALKENYPQLVANYYRFDGITSAISSETVAFRENIQVGDATLLDMFGFELLHGNHETALDQPFSVVITTQKAMRYFGRKDVLGETLTLENFSGERRPFEITGVMEKPFKNVVTYLNDKNDNQIFIPENTLSFFNRDINQWTNHIVIGFVELQPNVKPVDLDQPIQELLANNCRPFYRENLTPKLVPLDTYYLNANNGVVKKMMYILSGITLFILLMSITNFINISISQSEKYLPEIGLRKSLGGKNKEMMIQFFIENGIKVFLSICIGVCLFLVLQPQMVAYFDMPVLKLTKQPMMIVLVMLGLWMSLTTLAGMYPAFTLMKLSTVSSLKGKVSDLQHNGLFRKALLAFQFLVAGFVLICAIIVGQQIHHFFGSSLGYNKDYVLAAQVSRDWTAEGVQEMIQIRDRIAQTTNTSAVSLSYEIPDGYNGGQAAIYRTDRDSTTAEYAEVMVADEQFAKAFDLRLLAGHFFTEEGRPYDPLGVVINETQCRILGWEDPAEAVGQQIIRYRMPTPFTIRGVIKDFHFNDMRASIKPAIYFHVTDLPLYRYLCFKLPSHNPSQALAEVGDAWKKFMPHTPFEYEFMDESLAQMYQSEIQLQKASKAATFMAVVLVLLGVFGLVAQSIQLRNKEIGIRKVVGASPRQIIGLFVRGFTPSLLFAWLMASLLAWIFMQRWLNEYVNRIALTPLPFVLAFLILGGLAISLIALQVWKVSRRNPAEAIASE